MRRLEELKDKSVMDKAKRIKSDYKLCDSCLGRIFAKLGTDMTNQKRGKILREELDEEKVEEVNCWLCRGLIAEIPDFAKLILNSLEDYEFETFLVGSKVDEDIIEREKQLTDLSGDDYSESIKRELNREIGKILEEKLSNKEVDFDDPHIMTIVDTSFDVVDLQIKSLFIYGRYKKLIRGIPQTKWFCKICYGKGCRRCDYTGKMYDTSVEELIAKPVLEKTDGDEETFHGCGREDIDILMLGNGRPFVLEIKNPRFRSIDLDKLKEEINDLNKGKVEVCNLRFTDKDEVVRIKRARHNKVYRLTFETKTSVNNEKLKKAARCLQGKTIDQFTPTRVSHRRSNKVRKRKIYDCKLCSAESSDEVIMEVEAEAGTYIKELVSGDDDKTNPNISQILNADCEVKKLDVIGIKGE